MILSQFFHIRNASFGSGFCAAFGTAFGNGFLTVLGSAEPKKH